MTHARKVTRDLPTFPIQILTDQSILLGFNGTFHQIQNIFSQGIEPDIIALAIEEVERNKDLPQALQSARDFTYKFYLPGLHNSLEELAADYYKYPAAYEKSSIKNSLESNSLPEEFLTSYIEHYKAHKGKKADERYSLIETQLNKWLNSLTVNELKPYVRALADNKLAEIIDIKLLGKDKEFTRDYISKIRDIPLSRLTIVKEYEKLPEWMQVLSNNSGMRIFIGTKDTKWLGSSHTTKNIINISLAKNLNKNPDILHIALREEITHSLTDTINSNPAHHRLFVMDWSHEANRFIKNIEAHPQAVALIKKTEATGGSLLYTPEIAYYELLTDIIDAEFYLRKKENKSKEDAEKELRDVFGDKLYDLSRKMISVWVDQAAEILTKEIGAEKAQAFKQKWLDDPLCHTITLTELPEYNLTARLAAKLR